MSGSSLKEKARMMAIDPHSRYALLQKLILEGFLDSPVSSKEVVLRIRERSGNRWKTSYVQTYMQKFMKADIVHAIKPSGHRENYWVLASVKREQALRLVAKRATVREIQEELFSGDLVKHLKKNFGRELEELHDNFGKNGNCTAFLLRKILEKLIIIVLSKNGQAKLLEDRNREKLHGVPFLVPKTANEIKGIKFLGDTAAHNPLVSVEMSTIVPQMPYIITAYEELAKRL